MSEPLSETPAEEGDDQLAAEGTEVPPVEDGDLQDAPAPDPNAPDDPEDSEAGAA